MRGSRGVVAAARMATVLVALALTAAPCTAEERKGSKEIGFFAGNAFYANELGIGNGVSYGIRLGYNWKPAYEIELQYRHVGDEQLQNENSTLVRNPTVFLANPRRKFLSDSYIARYIINPGNERRRFKPYLGFGLGLLYFTPSPDFSAPSTRGDNRARVVTLAGGIRFRMTPYMSFRAEFEEEYAVLEIYQNQHMTAGLTWVFGGGVPADSDGDGVLDLRDRCPDTPKGALVDKHDGCPWDLDGDGVMDGIDKCPDTPRSWPVDEQGCPLDSDGDGVPDGLDKEPDTPKGALVTPEGRKMDTDGDGIPDGLDKCPDTPKGAIVDPIDSATAGCPHDADNDGVVDGVDQCPLTPPGATVDEKGCPQDSDGDRVLDGIDQCPDTPRGQKIDKEGCPRVRLDKPEAQILQNVKFLKGIELYPGTDAWIELLVDAMNYWSDVTVELGVYTDGTGTPAGNRAVAQRRGEVLKAWLVQHGIDAKRLVVKGYGATSFIADNETEEGREKNKRVEVKRLSGDLRRHPKPQPEAPEGEEKPPAAAPPAAHPVPTSPAPAAPAPAGPSTPPAPSPAPSPAPAPSPSPEASPTPAPHAAPAPEAKPSPSPSPSPGE